MENIKVPVKLVMTNSLRSDKRRKLGRGLPGNYEMNTIRPEKDRTRRFTKVQNG